MFARFNALNVKNTSAPIEVHTLVQQIPDAAADAALARMLNDGWRCENLSITSAFVPGEKNKYGVEGRGEMRVLRVVTLTRSCPPPAPPPEATAEKLFKEAVIIDAPGDEDEIDTAEIDTAESEPTLIEPETPAPVRVVGRVMTAAEAAFEQKRAARKPLEEVTFYEALKSGLYDAAELRQIGDRQALEAGLEAAIRVQQQQNKNDTWISWQFRLPKPN